MSFRISKFSLIVAAFSVLVFMNDSTGFDFYAHSVSYYFYDQTLNYVDVLFGEIILPRYWLLSYLYEVFSRIGIPAGYLTSFLIGFPIYLSAKKIIYARKDGKPHTILLSDVLVITFFYLLAFFYSGLSLVLIWFVAYLIVGSRLFLLGGFFHPVGFLLYLSGVVFFRKKIVFFIFVFVVFLLFVYLSTLFVLFTSSIDKPIRFYIDEYSVLKLIGEVFDRKRQEIYGLVIISIAFYIGKDSLLKKVNFLNSVRVSLGFFYFYSFFIFMFLFFSMWDKPTFINSILTLSVNDVVYASWFDWGSKDLTDSYLTLYNKRY